MTETKIICESCRRKFGSKKAKAQHDRDVHHVYRGRPPRESCIACGTIFGVLEETGMCGPCTTGEADTVGP
jgi:hypothetical protein